MKKHIKQHKDKVIWGALIAQFGHIFCCVIPAVFSILSVLSSIGLMSIIPPGLQTFHEAMHDYEIYIIIISLCLLLMGWAFYWYAKRIDCHSTGCVHEPCGSKKDIAKIILIIATCLSVINVGMYIFVHADETKNILNATEDHIH